MNTTKLDLVKPKAVVEATSPRCEATPQAPTLENVREWLQDYAYGVAAAHPDIDTAAWNKIMSGFAQVTAQRDELLAALKAIVSFQDEVLNEIGDDREQMTDAENDREQSAWALARAAITKAETTLNPKET